MSIEALDLTLQARFLRLSQTTRGIIDLPSQALATQVHQVISPQLVRLGLIGFGQSAGGHELSQWVVAEFAQERGDIDSIHIRITLAEQFNEASDDWIGEFFCSESLCGGAEESWELKQEGDEFSLESLCHCRGRQDLDRSI